MAVIKNMMVRAGADFSDFVTQAKKASRSMTGMKTSVSQSCAGVKKAMSGVGAALGALGVAFSISALVSGIREAVEEYNEQAEAEMKLATAMRNSMGARNGEIQSVLDLCDAQQQLGVISADTQAAGAQELATYVKTSATLKTLIPVMNDIAAQQYGMKASAEQVTGVATMLGKVMEGQTGALSRYGYSFTEAEENILKYGTEAQRAATLAQVVEASVGGMNRALAATPSGQIQQLNNALSDTRAQFGAAAQSVGVLLLPVLWKVASALATITAWAQRAANAIRKGLGGNAAAPSWQTASGGVSNLSDQWADLGGSIGGAGSAAKEAKRQLMGFDTLNILNKQTSGGGGGGGGLSDLGDMGPDIENFADSLLDMSIGFDDVTEAGEDIPLLTQTVAAFKDVWDGIKNTDWSWSGIWESLKDMGGGIADSFRTVRDGVWNGLKQLGSDMDLMFIQPLRNAWDDVKAFAKNVPQALKDMAGGIADSWRTIKDKGSEMWQSVVKSFRDMAGGIADSWNSVTAAAAQMRESLVASITALAQRIASPFKNLIEKFKSFYSDCADFVRKIRSLFNFQWQLPKFKTPHLTWGSKPVGGWIGKILSTLGLPTSLPDLRVSWYAKGGVFDRASLIGVGEAGKEAVVPLERNAGWISRVAGELAAQMTGGAGMLSGDALIEGIHDAVYDAMTAVMGTQGRSSGGSVSVNINGREFYRATYGDMQAVIKERGVAMIKT